MRNTIKAILSAALLAAPSAWALDTNMAFRIDAEVQTAGMQSLPDLTWVQGASPLVEVRILKAGRPVALSTNVLARMLVSSNLYTADSWAVVTNSVLTTNATASSMWCQWGEVGTNSCPTNSNTPAAWGYTIFFEDAVTGTRYWNGAGRLYIERSTATGNGMTWVNPTSLTSLAWAQIYGDPTNNAALVAYIVEQAGADSVARAGVASNAAAIVTNGAVSSNAYRIATNAQATANGAFAAYSNLPSIPTNSIGITALGGLVDGGRGESLTITNFGAYNIFGKAVGNRNILNVYSPDIGPSIGRVNVGGDLIVSNRAYFLDGIYTNLLINGCLTVNRNERSDSPVDYTCRFYENGNAEFDIDMRNNDFPYFSIETDDQWLYYTVNIDGDLFLTKQYRYTGQVDYVRSTIHANPNATTVTLGGVSRTNWPEGGTGSGTITGATVTEGSPLGVTTNAGVLAFTIPAAGESGSGATNGTASPYIVSYSATTTVSSATSWNQVLTCDNTQPLTLQMEVGSTNLDEQVKLALWIGTNTCILTNFSGTVPVASNSTLNLLLMYSPAGTTNRYVRRVSQ